MDIYGRSLSGSWNAYHGSYDVFTSKGCYVVEFQIEGIYLMMWCQRQKA